MAIDPRVDVGHVHLKVADLERALAFWNGEPFDIVAPPGEAGDG